MKLIEIFKPGVYTAMDGTKHIFSEQDVRAIATVYDPAIYTAPLVIGHPAHDAPAYGDVASLRFDGILKASPDNVEPQFADMVNAGRFNRISASLYAPDAPNNPVPGAYYLRHVGFLGAQPPAVKGLKPASFGDNNSGVIAFSDLSGNPEHTKGDDIMDAEKIAARQKELDTREAGLSAREATLAAAENDSKHGANVAFADGLVKEGKLLAVNKAGLVAVLDYADGVVKGDTIEFGEGDGKKSLAPAVILRELFAGVPKQIHFGEFAGGNEDPGKKDGKIPADITKYV